MPVELRVDINQNSQSPSNNSSNVTVAVVAKWTFGSFNVNQKSGTCTIDGTEYSFTSSFNTGKTQTGEQVIYSKTFDAVHNSVGERTVRANASYVTGVSSGTIYAEKSKDLTPIPRASTFGTITGNTLGSPITVNISRSSSTYTHQVWYRVGSSAWVDLGTGIGTSISFTPNISYSSQFPNATSGDLELCLRTYSGTKSVGLDLYKIITVNVPASVVPSISSITTEDPSGNLGIFGSYIQGKSSCKVTVSAAGLYGSSISTYSIIINGSKYTSNPATSGTLITSGNLSVSVTVTDSRGRTAQASRTITVAAYSNPTISTLTAYRCLSDGTADEDGAYMKVTIGASITPLGNINEKTIKLNYKKHTDSSYTTEETFTTYTVSETRIIAADVNSSYDVQITAQDSFYESVKTIRLGTASTIMDFLASGKGMSIGKVSEQEGLDVGWDARFKNITATSVVTTSGANLDLVTPRWKDITAQVDRSTWSINITDIWNSFYEMMIVLKTKSGTEVCFYITYREFNSSAILSGYYWNAQYNASVGIIGNQTTKVIGITTGWTRVIDNGTAYDGVSAISYMNVYWR